MRIGIDFDNTIVSYDALFHEIACERAGMPASIKANKTCVREHFARVGQEPLWTELQGYVYGSRMQEALIFDGVIDFLGRAKAVGHDLFVVSHKTRHPVLGQQYDLHAAAWAWIDSHLISGTEALLARENIFFELTKSAKIARIALCQCDAFIDDLPEILLGTDFPEKTARLLFDPHHNHRHASAMGLRSFNSWESLDAELSCCGVRD